MGQREKERKGESERALTDTPLSSTDMAAVVSLGLTQGVGETQREAVIVIGNAWWIPRLSGWRSIAYDKVCVFYVLQRGN